MVRELGLFDLDQRYRKLSEVGDPLVRVSDLINFEVFRPTLTTALRRSEGSRGGRPPYDAVGMFKGCCKRCTRCQTTRRSSSCATGFRSCVFWALGFRIRSSTPRRSGGDAPYRRTASRTSVLRLAANDLRTQQGRPWGQPQAGAGADAGDGIEALVPRPGTSKAAPGHKITCGRPT